MLTRPTRPATKLPPRPAGRLVWFHATNETRLLALCDVARSLRAQHPDITTLLSWDPELARPDTEALRIDLVGGPLTGQKIGESREFLDRWRPDAAIWAGGPLPRRMLGLLKDRLIPAALVDLTGEDIPKRSSGWLPDQRRGQFMSFHRIFCADGEAARQIARLGVTAARVQETGPLRLNRQPPDCFDEDLSALQEKLGSRPVWLAAGLPLAELEAVMAAHRRCLRLLHRLVLVVALADLDDHDAALGQLRAAGLSVASWEDGQEPDDYTQVILGGVSDLGLWYRIAPVTFLGGSLERGARGQDPQDAAALGSALLYGPGVRGHAPLYHRLEQAGAARKVFGKKDLADAVHSLCAPDLAAEMAINAWALITEGAETATALLEYLPEILPPAEETQTDPGADPDARP